MGGEFNHRLARWPDSAKLHECLKIGKALGCFESNYPQRTVVQPLFREHPTARPLIWVIDILANPNLVNLVPPF